MGMSMIESQANLPADVQQVPDGKSFLPHQHGGNAVSLYVLHGGAQDLVDLTRTVELRDIRAVQSTDRIGFRLYAFNESLGLFLRHFQPQGFQSYRLSIGGIVGLVDDGPVRLGDFAQEFESANLCRHARYPRRDNRTAPVCKTHGR